MLDIKENMVKEDRKSRIIDEAVKLFGEQGYYKTTTAQIAQAAGVTQPYVFHFFKNKEELYIEVLNRALRRLKAQFQLVEAPPEQLMEAMGKAFSGLLETHRDETLMVMQAHSISEPLIRDHVREQHREFHVMISQRFQEANVSNPEMAASQFVATGLLITLAEVLALTHISSCLLE